MKLTKILEQAVRSCFKRFPAPSAFATALALFCIFFIFVQELPDNLVSTIYYFLFVGLVMTLTLALWAEERTWTRKVSVIHALSYLILIGDTLYLYFTNFGDNGLGHETMLMHASAILALVLTVFFLSFSREKDDIPAWNFAVSLVLSAAICWGVGLILWGGLCLLMSSFKLLFNVDFDPEWYAVAGVLVAAYLPLLLFLSRIPAGERKHDSEPVHSGFLAGIFRYLFLPLEALYILVLYAYAIQILLRWELPNGQVSWLVIASMVGLFVIEYGLYPTRHAENRPFDNVVARLLPLIVMPLLLLMTVGIVRRFSDYGITIARLYLVTLNLWCYAVCIYLFLTRARRIHWIPISFAALFLLTSALPVNYTRITHRILMHQVKRALLQAGATSLPVNAKGYDELLKPMPVEEAARISSKLQYLEQTFKSQSIEPLVTQQTAYVYFQQYIDAADTTTVSKDERTYFSNYAHCERIRIEGYTELYADVSSHDARIDLTSGIVEVPVSNDHVSDTLLVSPAQLKVLDEKMNDLVPIPTKSGRNRFLLQDFSLIIPSTHGRTNSESPTLSLRGYLLTK